MCIPPAPANWRAPLRGLAAGLIAPLEQGATVDIRKTRYGRVSLVFVEFISDEHPELLDDAPAPQDAAAGEADEMDLESEGA